MKKLFVIISCFVALNGYTQNKSDKELSIEAEEKFKAENYEDALEDYLSLISSDPKNETYNYNAAVCYLNSNINKAKAVTYMEIVTRKEKHNPNADFLLGRAYQYANRFEDAIASFTKFKENGKGTDENLKAVDQEIQYCLNAKELIKFPVNVTFQSLGKIINSEFSDYYPFVTEKESYIVFNSKRPVKKDALKMENGQYLNSIFISKVVNGAYMEASVIGAPICEGNSGEEIIGMSGNGEMLLIHKKDARGAGKIYSSTMGKDGYFSKPEPLPTPINDKGDEIAVCVSADGNLIYFASDREGGFGGTDIYVCRLLPSGKWSDAKNLGVGVNTPQNEDFPNISPDGKTMYFSSKGHASMGGYDIFKATWDETQKRFVNPRNMGYPVNTSYDDMNFRISKTGQYGYLASVRGTGVGDNDIYRIIFNDADVDYTVIIGQITSKDKSPVNYRDAFITVNDLVTNEALGNYLPNPANGRFIIIVPPGKYNINVEVPGFKNSVIPVEVFDKSSYQSQKNLTVQLKK